MSVRPVLELYDRTASGLLFVPRDLDLPAALATTAAAAGLELRAYEPGQLEALLDEVRALAPVPEPPRLLFDVAFDFGVRFARLEPSSAHAQTRRRRRRRVARRS